jgi:hypothetical protein
LRQKKDILPISFTDVALSVIFSYIYIDNDRQSHIFQSKVRIFGGNSTLADAFVHSQTIYFRHNNNHYIQRGHIAFSIDKEANFPPAMLNTLFWARWTGTPEIQIPQESFFD